MQVVSGVRDGRNVITRIETADDGDYLFAPHFFCMMCWEEMTDALTDASKSHRLHRTIYHSEHLVRCFECNSAVLDGEIFATVCSGALQPSPRTPFGVPEVDFKGTDRLERPVVLCIGCMKLLDSCVKELWNADVSQGDECDEGTYKRCWRQLKCTDCIVR